jgi:ankyrin repeat protein
MTQVRCSLAPGPVRLTQNWQSVNKFDGYLPVRDARLESMWMHEPMRRAGVCATLSLLLLAWPASAQVPLIEAVRGGDVQATRALLQKKTDVNAAAPDGATALHWAAIRDDLAAVELLLAAGASVAIQNDYGITPLWLASTNGNAAIADRLLNAGADPNTTRSTGETVLMVAARTGALDVVRLLVNKGAVVEAREPARGQTALMWAAAEGHAPAVRFLVEHGGSVRARSTAGYTPLLLAARDARLEATRVLLDAGADVNEEALDGTTALVIATIRGRLSYAEFLLERGADPNRGPGFTPLHWAAGEWHTELTGSLTGVLAENTEWSTLGGLRGEQKVQMVKMLLARGADVSARAAGNPRVNGTARAGNLAGATPFLMAARAGDAAMMKLLLSSGAKPDVTTTRGTTALMLAAGVGGQDPGISWVTEAESLEAVTLALELGGDVNAVDASGETALHGAAYRGSNAVVRFLVDRGARLNVKNARGWTPLTIAEGVYASNFNTFPATAALLRTLGAEATAPDVERDATVIIGRTPR